MASSETVLPETVLAMDHHCQHQDEVIKPTAPELETEVEVLPDEEEDESSSLYTADVIRFVVRGKVLSAHRKLLEARSPVFAAMFKHQLKEKKEKQVVIPDIDVKVFQKLLQFVYKDKVTGLEQYAVPLWIAADKVGDVVCFLSLR